MWFSKSTGLTIPSASVPAPTVVDHFNPVSNGLAGGITGCPALTVVELGFKASTRMIQPSRYRNTLRYAPQTGQPLGCGTPPRVARW